MRITVATRASKTLLSNVDGLPVVYPGGSSRIQRSKASSWYRVMTANMESSQYDTISDLAYSMSLACGDQSVFRDLLPRPNALMQSQLRLSKMQLNNSKIGAGQFFPIHEKQQIFH